MASYGIPHADIARVVRLSAPTLRKHFRRELDTAAVNANAAVAQTLFKTATKGGSKESVTAGIFWMKARAGWTDRLAVDASVTNDGPAVEIYLPNNGRDAK